MKLRFRFGQPHTALDPRDNELHIDLQNQVIAGSGEESWTLPDANYAGADAFGWHRWESADFLCVAVMAPVTQPSLREISRTLYAALIDGLGGRSFYRIWNFIPAINRDYGELDTYKVFCLGRAEALEAAHGSPLPAASAVGTPGEHLVIVALAGTGDAVPVENPLQVPAWRYPERYGPRSPSFARATRVNDAELFVSGTASIRRSESLHDGDVVAQFRLAAENIDLVIRAASLSSPGAHDPERGGAAISTSRIYLRHPGDWPAIEAPVRRSLEPRDGAFNVIQAEICRPELLVEAETHLRFPG